MKTTSMMNPEATLLTATHGPVRLLTLNRPAALNSFTAQMNVELRAALARAHAHDDSQGLKPS